MKENQMTIINNVTRLLDSHKIKYTAYELPAEKLGALETARLLNVDPAVVFKTIVVTRDKPEEAFACCCSRKFNG